MEVREAIERLNRNKFNINYNCNKYEWELVIFEDEFIKLSLNFTNFDTAENHLEIYYDYDFYADVINLKDTNDLINVLAKTEFYIDRFMEEMQDNLKPELAYI